MNWQGQATRPALPYEADWFRQSLAEAIIWCTGLPIQNNPYESPEIKLRRELAGRAAELNHRTFLSNWPDFVKGAQYLRARRMFSKSRLGEIAPLETQLRSPELKPTPFPSGKRADLCQEIVDSVIRRRAVLLQTRCRAANSAFTDLNGGRLLLFAPWETLSDGAARYASKGFFDDDNIPAWDTWVAYVESYVVSWVPAQLIELANAGVDANPEQCILWA